MKFNNELKKFLKIEDFDLKQQFNCSILKNGKIHNYNYSINDLDNNDNYNNFEIFLDEQHLGWKLTNKNGVDFSNKISTNKDINKEQLKNTIINALIPNVIESVESYGIIKG